MKTYNLESISLELVSRIEDILDSFDVEYQMRSDMIVMKCPVHNGDNPEGASLLLQDIGNFICYTNQCHETYGSSVINFIWRLLCKENEISMGEAITWCANLVGETEEQNITKDDRTSFIQLVRYLNPKKKTKPMFVPRDRVRQGLIIPSPYYIDRNYSSEILDKYDVGDCRDTEKSMFNRAVVPFYDDDYEYMVGCMGRSLFEKCPICNSCHPENSACPRHSTPKWKNSSGFIKDSLYNYWFARDFIDESETAIIVEGPGDVWRLEEAGFHNGVALLGTIMTPGQRVLLERTGATRLILALDNDDAGKSAMNKIVNQCKLTFNLNKISINEDVGSTPINVLQELLNDKLENIVR
jgi:5S rRNA maturation endonuclease (ribonuclease M5)